MAQLATIGAVVTNLMRVALVGLLIWWALRIEGRVAMATAIALLRQFLGGPDLDLALISRRSRADLAPATRVWIAQQRAPFSHASRRG